MDVPDWRCIGVLRGLHIGMDDVRTWVRTVKIEDLKLEELTLEVLTFGASLIEGCFPQNLRYETEINPVHQQLLHYLTWNLLGKKVDTYTHPKTWWDAFKDYWYPNFLRRRFPPQFTTIDRYHVCPHINIAWAKDQNPHFHFLNSEFIEKGRRK